RHLHRPKGGPMVAKTLVNALRPTRVAHAHCDLPCGVYDPAQAKIEAESVKACQQKFQDSDDPIFKQRAVMIKEQRADLVKHHLWVLWTDYFTPAHLEAHPNLHEIFWHATKTAGWAKKTHRHGRAPQPPSPERRDRQDLLGDQEVATSVARAAPAGRPGPKGRG